MRILICLVVILLSGCSSTKPMTANIMVPVSASATEVPQKPYLPIYSLTESSKDSDTIKAYVASINALNGYADTLLDLLDTED